MEAGEFVSEAKDQMMKLFPNAYCKRLPNEHPNFWMIVADEKQVTHSWNSEAQAWDWALSITNKRILDKFKGLDTK
jgi:hypothetical protein